MSDADSEVALMLKAWTNGFRSRRAIMQFGGTIWRVVLSDQRTRVDGVGPTLVEALHDAVRAWRRL